MATLSGENIFLKTFLWSGSISLSIDLLRNLAPWGLGQLVIITKIEKKLTLPFLFNYIVLTGFSTLWFFCSANVPIWEIVSGKYQSTSVVIRKGKSSSLLKNPPFTLRLAQGERNIAWNYCRFSVHAELVEASRAVFQHLVNAKKATTGRNNQFGTLPIPSPKASVGLKIHGFSLQRLKTSINNSYGPSLHLL